MSYCRICCKKYDELRDCNKCWEGVCAICINLCGSCTRDFCSDCLYDCDYCYSLTCEQCLRHCNLCNFRIDKNCVSAHMETRHPDIYKMYH